MTIQKTTHDDLQGWLPVRISWTSQEAPVTWLHMPDVVLVEPFFRQTVERYRRDAIDLLETQAELGSLRHFQDDPDCLPPSGLVFHMSRCGSTLVANALRAVSDSLVLSEAQPLSALLLSQHLADIRHYKLGSQDVEWRSLLSGAMKAFGQRRQRSERLLFVKFESWNIMQVAAIKAIWPKVPCAFIFRNPVEMIVSNLEKPPTWYGFKENPGTATHLFGSSAEELARMSDEEFYARAAGAYCTRAADLAGPGTLFLNYENIRPEVLVRLLQHFGVFVSQQERAAVEEVMKRYSKDATQTRDFVPDIQYKRKQASLLTVQMSERWSQKPYRRLNAISQS